MNLQQQQHLHIFKVLRLSIDARIHCIGTHFLCSDQVENLRWQQIHVGQS